MALAEVRIRLCERAKTAFRGALSRCAALGFEPVEKILHTHPMLDGRVADTNSEFGQTLSDLIDPGIFSQDGERAGNRLIKRFRRNLKSMFSAAEIPAGHRTGL